MVLMISAAKCMSWGSDPVDQMTSFEELHGDWRLAHSHVPQLCARAI